MIDFPGIGSSAGTAVESAYMDPATGIRQWLHGFAAAKPLAEVLSDPLISCGMKNTYPPVGSKWKEIDTRVHRTVEIIRHDMNNRRVRIHCIETERLTWAKPERFNSKSGGYQRAD